MKSKPKYQKYKQLRLSDGRLIGVQTYLSFRLYIAFEGLESCYDSQKEKFRDLICNGEIIEGFTQDDYRQLSDDNLEIIAGKILENRQSTKGSGDSVFINLFLEMDREIKELKELKESVARSFRPWQEKMTEVIKPFQELSKRIEELYDPIALQIQAMMSQWSETVNKFLEERREYLDAKEKASLIASKYDWFIAYDFYVSKEFFEKLVELDEDSSDIKELDALFTEYYGAEIRKQIISDLIDIDVAKEYEEILNQIESGYEQKLFYLVIPALFALIEGMIARGFQHKGRMNGKQFKKYINELLDGDETDCLQEIINKRMLVSFEHGEEVNSPISRHAILHGGDIKFGTEAAALRLLLIFCNLAFAIVLRDVMPVS